LDISRFGGLTPLRKAAYIGEAYGVKTAFHGPGDISPIAHAAQVHLDYHVSNFGIQEFLHHDSRVWDVFTWDFQIENGYLKVGDAPGLGVSVNETAAWEYPYRKSYIPGLRDVSGAVHDW
jgi:mannonate dehydratase